MAIDFIDSEGILKSLLSYSNRLGEAMQAVQKMLDIVEKQHPVNKELLQRS